jgi:hypothetical protein
MASMYFASNQRKQHAFDKYYNAMAKSNFKQGRRFRALIQDEADDTAMTDKLASLYSSSLAKGNDYEYDSVDKKMKMKKKVIKPTEETPMPVASAANSWRARRQYRQESTDTDTDTESARGRRSSVEYFMNEPNTAEFMDIKLEETRNPNYKAKEFEKKVRHDVHLYVQENQKDARKDAVNKHRIMNKKEQKEAEKVLSDDILSQVYGKRGRTASMVSNAPDHKKAASATSNIYTTLDDGNADNESDNDDTEIKKERELKKLYPKMRKNITKAIDDFKFTNKSDKVMYYPTKLYNRLKTFSPAIDNAKGEGYFSGDAPKPVNGQVSKDIYDKYKAELKGWINGVFI